MVSRRELFAGAAALVAVQGLVACAKTPESKPAPPVPAAATDAVFQIARRYVFESEDDLAPGGEGEGMPMDSVTMAPGVYRLGSQTWDCTKPGLYRFKIEREAFFRNRIVVQPGDLYSLVSSVCWNVVQGTAHEWGANMPGISDIGRFVVWRMRCGYIGNFMAWLLPQHGYEVRQVGVVARPEGRNGYDDGHQVLEVRQDGRWVMFDIVNGCYWKNEAGVHLDTAQFIEHIADGRPFPQKVKLDGNQRRWNYDQIPLPDGTVLDMGLYGELCVTGIETSEGWIRRVFYQTDLPPEPPAKA